MNTTHFNQTSGPLPLDGGRVLAPGEGVELADLSDHDQALEDEHKLGRLSKPKRTSRTKTTTQKEA